MIRSGGAGKLLPNIMVVSCLVPAIDMARGRPFPPDFRNCVTVRYFGSGITGLAE